MLTVILFTLVTFGWAAATESVNVLCFAAGMAVAVAGWATTIVGD